MAFQGSLSELPLPDIIQLVSVSGKTGMFLLKNGDSEGRIYLHQGQIVHGETGKLAGEEAVYEMAIWQEGDFVFHPSKETAEKSVRRSNTNLLMEAARRIDEWKVLSKRIPSTRMVPVFTNHSATTSVSLSPQEWSLISKVDERRSIEEIAIGLGKSPFEICKLLFGLITSQLVGLKDSLSGLSDEQLQKIPAELLPQIAEKIRDQAQALLSSPGDREELDQQYRLSLAELEAGRQLDALLDLVRSTEKVVSGALGPNQAQTFLEGINEYLSSF